MGMVIKKNIFIKIFWVLTRIQNNFKIIYIEKDNIRGTMEEGLRHLLDNTNVLQMLIDRRLSENIITIEEARKLRQYLAYMIDKLFSPDIQP